MGFSRSPSLPPRSVFIFSFIPAFPWRTRGARFSVSGANELKPARNTHVYMGLSSKADPLLDITLFTCCSCVFRSHLHTSFPITFSYCQLPKATRDLEQKAIM